MNIQTKKMYSEVYSILNMLGNDYINKLPSNLFDMIKEEKLDSYSPEYVENINLNQQNVKKDTLAMIALFHLNYWCNSEEEKEALRQIFANNEKEYQEKLRAKYNPDDLFKMSNIPKEEKVKYEITNHNNKVIAYKEKGLLEKIFNFIRNIYKR